MRLSEAIKRLENAGYTVHIGPIWLFGPELRRVKSADIEKAGEYLGEPRVVSRFWMLVAFFLFVYFTDAACTVYWYLQGMPEINLFWQPLLKRSMTWFWIARCFYIVLPLTLLWKLRYRPQVYLVLGVAVGYGMAVILQWLYGIIYWMSAT